MTTEHKESTPAAEDTLEQIHNLIDQKGYARVVDIAANLGISQASVSNMVQRLDTQGLVHYEKYRGMSLTPAGEEIARAITKRHAILADLLRLFGLDEETIHRDVEGMEHHISPATLRVFQALVEQLEAAPEVLDEVRKRVRLPMRPK